MEKNKNQPKDTTPLRQNAEAAFLKQSARSLKDPDSLSPEESRRMLHELRVHQIELEMQNEELRAAQEALDLSHARYLDLYDFAPVGYVTLSEKGLILEANLAAATLLGESRGNLVKRPISGFILREDEDIYYRHRKQLFETGEPQECELRMVKKDGALPFWARLEGTAAEGPDGMPACRVVMSDITGRKRAEENLNLAHDKMLTILDSIDSTVYVADMDTHEILFMNKKMITAFGGDKTGEICFSAFRKQSQPCECCTNDRLLDKNGNPSGVCTWHDQNPITNRFYINHDRAVEWVDGRLVRLQIATDITDLKKMEAQLNQAQKMESVGTLAGGIAHDFNNILFPIVGHTEMLMDDLSGENSTIRNSLTEIYSGALRARDLVQQILAFARQEENELKLMKMQPVVKEAMKLIRSTIPTTIPITQHLNPDCGPVTADPTQIHQIVMNLAANAYHAMEKDGGELRVDLKEIQLGKDDLIDPDMSPGLYACLSIGDTGAGMSKDVMNRIFDPFFTTKERGKGTGMGLAVVHGIVKGMKGDIRVYSEPGKGAEFKVYLPVVGDASEKPAAKADDPIQRGGESILLVDDEDAIIKMEKLILERLGYEVATRPGSLEALEAFRADPDKFDLVITDMSMPNLSGDKLANELIKIRPDIPILLCTGYSESMSDEKMESLGIKGFLMKPIMIKEFARKIREVLDGSRNQIP